MKVQQNIGMLNALVRITAGLTVLSWSTAKLAEAPEKGCYLLTALLGAMKVGEGAVRYCPLTDLICEVTDAGEQSADTSLTDEFLPYNPS
ncbi:DUF2892 domain-containing protein [Mesobacillus zeae]|uniref:DUF2892 domain-containing protein n=1 Tax=Mesobacillus zeae TaxID=1917180 RepID=A0A398AYU2_9BACI|nr:DUF2892 domain-containing protein [Mesobacillus zeae]RID81868.1 DUF2892 domain-containing protein [Mesobacillus zeae]